MMVATYQSLYVSSFLQVQTLKRRLLKRKYPSKFIEICCGLISYKHRQCYLAKKLPSLSPTTGRPVFRCLSPPRFSLLKFYHSARLWHHKTPRPLFTSPSHPHLKNTLIRCNITPTLDQSFDLSVTLPPSTQEQDHQAKNTNTSASTIVIKMYSRYFTIIEVYSYWDYWLDKCISI